MPNASLDAQYNLAYRLERTLSNMMYGAAYASFFSYEPKAAAARTQNLMLWQRSLNWFEEGVNQDADVNRLLLFDLVQRHGISYHQLPDHRFGYHGHLSTEEAAALNARYSMPDRAKREFVEARRDGLGR